MGGWIEGGFPADKLVLGVAGYGRSFTLASEPEGNAVGQEVTGGGAPAPYSGSRGMLDYGEVTLLKESL